jgi:hypothetical protein
MMPPMMSPTKRVYGVDFSSAPSAKKPITVAVGELCAPTAQQPAVFAMHSVVPCASFAEFDDFLRHQGPWIAGFDLPFSLPRPLIEHYGWPCEWPAFIDWYARQARADLRIAFKEFCNARPAGNKFVYRRTDRPAGSSPAMRWTNPPVAWMLHAGAPRIKSAGVCIPGIWPGTDAAQHQRIALEAYPGFTARQVSRASYKSDERKKQTPARQQVREQILSALCNGQAGLLPLLTLDQCWTDQLINDGAGDLIDAAICALQAAHAAMLPNYGFPQDMDPLEGWIASVPVPLVQAAPIDAAGR